VQWLNYKENCHLLKCSSCKYWICLKELILALKGDARGQCRGSDKRYSHCVEFSETCLEYQGNGGLNCCIYARQVHVYCSHDLDLESATKADLQQLWACQPSHIDLQSWLDTCGNLCDFVTNLTSSLTRYHCSLHLMVLVCFSSGQLCWNVICV